MGTLQAYWKIEGDSSLTHERLYIEKYFDFWRNNVLNFSFCAYFNINIDHVTYTQWIKHM